jgi:hypothetical protein
MRSETKEILRQLKFFFSRVVNNLQPRAFKLMDADPGVPPRRKR